MYACPCQIGECVLCEAELFYGLSSEQVCKIRGLLTKKNFDVHEMLFREGDPCEHLFVLRTGQVKLTTLASDGREQILGLRVAGQLLGFDTFNDRGYLHTAVALTSVETCRIKHHDMLRVMERDSAVSQRVMRRLSEELEQAHTLIHDLKFKSAPNKVASFLLSLLPIRGSIPETFRLPLSRQEMAELMGLTTETVSRVISQFRRAGLILTPKGHIRILDYARLRALVENKDRPPSPG